MNGASKGTSGEVDLGTVITSHQSLDGYATEKWVEDKEYLTEHQSLDDYDTSAEVNRHFRGLIDADAPIFRSPEYSGASSANVADELVNAWNLLNGPFPFPDAYTPAPDPT